MSDIHSEYLKLKRWWWSFRPMLLNPDVILGKLLPNRVIAPYLSFWARLVVWVRKPFIIGITGSVGKTTTTAMITAVLTHPDVYPFVGLVGFASKNMNDDVGLPLTLLRYEGWVTDNPRSRWMMLATVPFRALRLATWSHYPKTLVLEFGTHWAGHLKRLARLAPPDVAVVTTIGPAHLERLKTLEGVVAEKSAVVRAVSPSGLVILGKGHDYVAELEQVARAPVTKVTGRGIEQLQNITRAVCRHLGIPEEIVDSALKDFKAPSGRLNLLKFDGIGMMVIDDSYNANPLSMKLGLDTLAENARPGQRRVAVLGGMGELGEESLRYHDDIGAYTRSRADVVIGVGELAKYYNPDFWFDSSNTCVDQIENLLRSDDCLLVKGSNSVRMKRVVEKLREIAENHMATVSGT